MKRHTFILPVYNEQEVLEESVTHLLKFLKTFEGIEDTNWKIVIADNLSNDDTANISKRLVDTYQNRIYYLRVNERGRGNALKQTVQNFPSDFYTYMDIDLPMELKDLSNLNNPVINGKADISVMKRRGKRPFFRKLLTLGLRVMSKVLLNLNLHDAQCGIKTFNKAIATKAIPLCKQGGYFLDTELLALAKRNGYKIKEVEVSWVDKRFQNRSSKINNFTESLNALWCILNLSYEMNQDEIKKYLLIILYGIPYILVLLSLAAKHSIFQAIRTPPLEITLSQQALLLILLAIYYSLSFPLLKNVRNVSKRITGLVFLFFIVSIIIALFIKPLFSQDQYWNLLLSKGYVKFGLNPYITVPNNMLWDSWSKYILVWRDIPIIHGPLSILFFAIPTLISNNISLNVFVLKLVSAVILISCVFVAKKSFKCIGEKLFEVLFLIAFNPFILFNTVIDVHNDILIALVLILSYFLFTKKKYTLSIVILFAGFLIKYASLFTLPILLLLIIKDKNLSIRSRVIQILKGLIFGVLGVLLFYLPFLNTNPLNLLNGIKFQINFGSMGLSTVFSYFLHFALGISNANLKLATLSIGVILGIYLSFKKGPVWAYIIPYLIIFFFGTTWLQPWYFLWIYPFLLFTLKRYQIGLLTCYLTLTLVLSTFQISGIFLILFTTIYLIIKIRDYQAKRAYE